MSKKNRKDPEKYKEYLRRHNKRRRDANLAAGLCPCGKVLVVGKRTCQRCIDRRAKRITERRVILKATGICRDCKKEPVRSQSSPYCQKCHDLQIAYQLKMADKRRDAGVCTACGKLPVAEGYKRCDECRKQLTARRLLNRIEVYKAYGGASCACCGEDRLPFLTLDHVENDGAKERKIHRTPETLYRHLARNNYPPGYQVLCWNCNCGRAMNGGVCPHKL